MSQNSLHKEYSQRISHFQAKADWHARRMGIISIFRLLALVAVFWLIFPAVRYANPIFYIGSASMLVLFFYLVKRFNFQKDLKILNLTIRKLNEKELSCQEHNFLNYPDGSEFADPHHPWSHDLDLFGRGSLYQYLNRTSTVKGKSLLAETLCTEPGEPAAIKNRQSLLADLKDRIDFRQTFTARGEMFKETEDDISGIEKWLSTETYITKYKWLFYIALLSSSLSIFFIVYGILVPGGGWYLLLLFILNLCLMSPFFMRTGQYQQSISQKHELLEGYALLMKLISETPFENAELAAMKAESGKGMKEVKRLSKLISLFDQRLNMLLGVLLNGFFLYDFIMLHFLERWKKQNLDFIMEWIRITGFCDSLISLSGFAWNHPEFTRPEVNGKEADGKEGPMTFKELGHPLIRPDKRVNNDLSVSDEKIMIITGANMAGKSTFLRSLGINTVLAYAGCPVCAGKFSMSYMGLFSSMRTADSLADEESYFLAEIKKLQRIVKRMEEGKPLLILLDEVLKGTNTTDKKLGSVGLIKRSLPYPVKCFIATHDLSLGELEKIHEGKVVNYCFESYIDDLKLNFDYTMRKGIATNMNASFLMKQMGIMD